MHPSWELQGDTQSFQVCCPNDPSPSHQQALTKHSSLAERIRGRTGEASTTSNYYWQGGDKITEARSNDVFNLQVLPRRFEIHTQNILENISLHNRLSREGGPHTAFQLFTFNQNTSLLIGLFYSVITALKK